MHRRLLLLIFLATTTFVVYAQDTQTTIDIQNYRTYDGTHNNLDQPNLGAAGTNLVRKTKVAYSDGISSMAGTDRPNPREVSNELFAQSGLLNDRMGLSDFCWVFGQFIDHDIGLTPDGTEAAMISVPAGDASFDPFNTGEQVIPMLRNVFDPSTGTSVDNPREHPNLITCFIDGSAVYGSDESTANWLRSFSGGKLKISEGNFLPYNTVTGEYDSEIDEVAPHMDNPTRISEKFFVAGDPRANENPLLLTFHTLFVREHNRLCDVIAEENPDWTDEQIFQHARKMVGGYIQSIVFNEWLVAMGVNLPAYQGYRPDVNPQLLNIFTGAAFRLGHTLLNSNIMRLDNNGEVIEAGNLSLRDAFFNPMTFVETGDIDPFLKGMGVQVQQSFDPKVIDDVRNFLFGAPGAGGLDLASININRGRERGFPDLNTVRQDFGLLKHYFFQQMNWDYNILIKMVGLYKNVNKVDPWVGMLVERPRPGQLFGETLMKIMEYQFGNLRDGDRFFFENDPILSDDEKEDIRNTRLHDVIMRNSSIELMQFNVFEAVPHEKICEENTNTITGLITTPHPTRPGVIIGVNVSSNNHINGLTGEDGSFNLTQIPGCEDLELSMSMIDNPSKGLSTYDLIQIQKHILSIEPIENPYGMLAADFDRSKSISSLDLILIRKVILGQEVNLVDDQLWVFIPEDYQFKNPKAPYEEDIPTIFNFGKPDNNVVQQNFIGIKLGDVDASALSSEADTRSADKLNLFVDDMWMDEGNVYEILVNKEVQEQFDGFQMAVGYDRDKLEVLGITSNTLNNFSEQNYNMASEELRLSWNTFNNTLDNSNPELFRLKIRAKASGLLSNVLSLGRTMDAEAYQNDNQPAGIQLNFKPQVTFGDGTKGLTVSQNEPNPFNNQTAISFTLTESTAVTLSVSDALGRKLYMKAAEYGAGTHRVNIMGEELKDATGLLFYSIETKEGIITKEMVRVK